jgi:hypothetical protein
MPTGKSTTLATEEEEEEEAFVLAGKMPVEAPFATLG